MGKKLVEAQLTTRAARSRLDEGLHWRGIADGIHLGYRRKARSGEWIVRWRSGSGYKREGLGEADDVLPADGRLTLDFNQASRLAISAVSERRAAEAIAAMGEPPTVRSAVEVYGQVRAARAEKRPGGRPNDAKNRLARHVMSSKLADMTLDAIKDSDLREWRAGLVDLSPTSAVRVVNDFKAALNRAGRQHAKMLPPGFAVTVKNGLASDEPVAGRAREMQILADFEIRDVIVAAGKVDDEKGYEGDFLSRISAPETELA